MKQIRKHLTILKVLTKNYLSQQMEYKCSFFTYLIVECIVLLSKLLYVGVTYNLGITINGVSPSALLLFNGTFFIISGIYGGFFMLNFSSFQSNVKGGGLDMLITKPVSLQFMCSFSTIEFATLIPNVVMGVILVVKAWRELQLPVTFINVAGYLYLLAVGVVIIYNLLFLPLLLSFKLIQTNSLMKITTSLSNFNTMPMHIYPKIAQRVGIFIFPIFIVTNFPAMFVIGELNLWYVGWGTFVAVALSVLVRCLWKYSLRFYSSAMG